MKQGVTLFDRPHAFMGLCLCSRSFVFLLIPIQRALFLVPTPPISHVTNRQYLYHCARPTRRVHSMVDVLTKACHEACIRIFRYHPLIPIFTIKAAGDWDKGTSSRSRTKYDIVRSCHICDALAFRHSLNMVRCSCIKMSDCEA